MANENCLTGFKCPECGHKDTFSIGGHAMFDVTDDGADVAQGYDIEWADEDVCICDKCHHVGTVGDFRKIRLPQFTRSKVNAEKRRLDKIRKQARVRYGSDEIAFDGGDIAVSEGDEGAFVAAWVWVEKE